MRFCSFLREPCHQPRSHIGAFQPQGVAAPLPDPKQARIDYMLKCQGCHRPDGGGDDRSNPPM
ncbi:MAG: hypothetical protein B7Y74_08440, partial [Novosphingobium sp. 35-62-5]